MIDWPKVEGAIGVALPEDYKEFIASYGTGKICDFLRVYNPAAADKGANLIWRFGVDLDALRTLRGQFPQYVTFDAFPARGGLIPWGITDNGDGLYWQSGPKWSVVTADSGYSEFERYSGTMTQFLSAVLSRQYRCGVFPDDFLEQGDAVFFKAGE
jgi:hypothetical protein